VSAVVADPWKYCVSEEGEKVHVVPAASPEQANDVVCSNPLSEVIVTLTFPELPSERVSDVGAIESEKSGAGILMVYAAELIGLVKYPIAVAMARIVSLVPIFKRAE
jgi:hypothetical protein